MKHQAFRVWRMLVNADDLQIQIDRIDVADDVNGLAEL